MIYVLTGPVHSGKTTFLKNTVLVMRAQDIRIDGYLSESIREKGELIGYNLLDLRNDRSHPFIRKKGGQNWESVGPFFFAPKTLDAAKKIILRSTKADLGIVDEVGPLELEGKGVWPAIVEILRASHENFLFVVRDSILQNFLHRINRANPRVFSIGQKNIRVLLAGSLISDLKERRRSIQK